MTTRSLLHLKPLIEATLGSSVNVDVVEGLEVIPFGSRNSQRIAYSMVNVDNEQSVAAQATCPAVHVALYPRPFSRATAFDWVRERRHYKEAINLLEGCVPAGVAFRVTYLVSRTPRRVLLPILGTTANLLQENRMLSNEQLNQLLDCVEVVNGPFQGSKRKDVLQALQAIGDFHIEAEAPWNIISWEELQGMENRIKELERKVANLQQPASPSPIRIK